MLRWWCHWKRTTIIFFWTVTFGMTCTEHFILYSGLSCCPAYMYMNLCLMIQWSVKKEKGLHIYVHVTVLFDSFQPSTFSVAMKKYSLVVVIWYNCLLHVHKAGIIAQIINDLYLFCLGRSLPPGTQSLLNRSCSNGNPYVMTAVYM